MQITGPSALCNYNLVIKPVFWGKEVLRNTHFHLSQVLQLRLHFRLNETPPPPPCGLRCCRCGLKRLTWQQTLWSAIIRNTFRLWGHSTVIAWQVDQLTPPPHTRTHQHTHTQTCVQTCRHMVRFDFIVVKKAVKVFFSGVVDFLYWVSKLGMFYLHEGFSHLVWILKKDAKFPFDIINTEWEETPFLLFGNLLPPKTAPNNKYWPDISTIWWNDNLTAASHAPY